MADMGVVNASQSPDQICEISQPLQALFFPSHTLEQGHNRLDAAPRQDLQLHTDESPETSFDASRLYTPNLLTNYPKAASRWLTSSLGKPRIYPARKFELPTPADACEHSVAIVSTDKVRRTRESPEILSSAS